MGVVSLVEYCNNGGIKRRGESQSCQQQVEANTRKIMTTHMTRSICFRDRSRIGSKSSLFIHHDSRQTLSLSIRNTLLLVRLI
jgi:hypothetical protein